MIFGFVASTLATVQSARAAEPLDYAVVDPEVRFERLDTSRKESFLSMRADSAGRLFVGGREAVFVYEPAKDGHFLPRRELLRFPADSWVYDIETRGNDLYVLTLSALYIVPNGVVQREGLQAKRLLWGVPRYHVHQCFHALAWGPEGDLYLSLGDTLVHYGDFSRPDHWGHWTFFSPAEKAGVPYTGQGGVLRIHPDGSGLQVVARGLRNCCGLVFDREWNLFGNDNDHESAPQAYVPGRLIHVTPHSDFGWPRGWMPHITPDRADLLETMFNGMGRAVPVGQSYLDSPAWPAKFRNNMLLARWGIRTLMRYPIVPRGASFSATEHPLLVGKNQARPVGVNVGPDGAIYVAIAFMAHNEGSPIYASDLVRLTPKTSQAGEQPVAPRAPFDVVQRSPSLFYNELSAASWETRRRAQVELRRRGGDALKEASHRLATAKPDDPARTSLIWLAAASAEPGVPAQLVRLAADPNPATRLQAVRALHEFFTNDPQATAVFQSRLADDHPEVVLAATDAFFDASPVPFALIARVAGSTDTYLRQAASLVLATRAPLDFFRSTVSAADEPTRLAGVLAVGFRLTLPAATKPIDAALPLTPWQPADIHRVRYLDETVDLRQLGRLGMFTTAEHWNARQRTDEEEALFGLLVERLSDPSDRVRLHAAHFLSLLDDPRSEPSIRTLRQQTERRRLANAPLRSLGRAWVIGPFADDSRGMASVHPPEQGPVDLAATYSSANHAIAWRPLKSSSMFDFAKAFGNCPDSSFYAYCRIDSPVAQQMLLLPGSDDGLKIWHNGRLVWSHEGIRGALPLQDVTYVDLQPGSNDLLFRVNNFEGECALYVHYRTTTAVSATLPERIGTSMLAERLKSGGAGATKIGPEFWDVDWPHAVRSGNAERGRKLFSADGIGCAKCHAIDDKSAAIGGPSLAGASARFTVPYLVESILAPSRIVSPVFRATLVVLHDGRTFTGLVLGETSKQIELLLPDATRKTIPVSEVEERKIQPTSPMPPGLVKTPDELRDLLAYLLKSAK